MGTSGASCCEGRDDKLKKRMSMPLQKRKLPPINDEVDNVLDNFADFMRQKHRLDQERNYCGNNDRGHSASRLWYLNWGRWGYNRGLRESLSVWCTCNRFIEAPSHPD